MRMRYPLLPTIVLCVCALLASFGTPAQAQPTDAKARIEAAAPNKAYAEPGQPRRLLVFSGTNGFRHGSIPYGVLAMKTLGFLSFCKQPFTLGNLF